MNRQKRILFRSLSILAGLMIAAFLINDIYKQGVDRINTQTAFEYTFEQTHDVKAYIVRNEEYVTASGTGISASLVGDGERVAINDPVAVMCGNSNDASVYAEIKDVEQKISRYTQLNSQKNLNTVNIKGFDDDVYSILKSLLNSVDTGNLSEYSEYCESFRDKATAREISISGAVDFSSKISELSSKLAELKSMAINAQEIFSESAGYFVSKTDGYEKTINYNNVTKLDYKDVESAFINAGQVPKGAIGKIVKDYNWYIVVVVENNIASQIEVGKNIKIIFPQSSIGRIEASIRAINTSSDGNSVVVFSSNNVSAQTLNMRIENAQIVLNEHTGYKIDSSAIRVSKETIITESDDAVETQKQVEHKGVYIKLGNIVRFRKVDIIYSSNDYVLSAIESKIDSGKRNEFVGMYDEIIVGGKDLQDGKILS
ncbi:MAG TPA: HlyD family efflux transporter periplasmic adaptor subunit [Clostridia bacterium]|nr:HlyD family efflux transporter periplasmic adaptor subunit [Clostridia bacterium]